MKTNGRNSANVEPLSHLRKLKSSNKFEIKHNCAVQCYQNLPLHSAAYRADEKDIQELLKNGYPWGIVDCHGKTPLHCATATINRPDQARRSVVLSLLNDYPCDDEKRKALVESEDIRKRTALHNAATNELPEIIELLLAAGASPTKRDVHGLTPIHLAVEGNSEAAIKCVKFLLAADETQKNSPCKSTRHYLQRNQTPLHIAAEEKSWNMVKYLLEIGCDCCALDSEGRTPLHVAVTAGNCKSTVKCVEQFVSNLEVVAAGCVTVEGNDTALHLAAEFGHSNVLKIILDTGKIDVWALNSRKQTALHRAAMCWFPDKALQCVQYLLENEQVGDTEMLRFAFLRDCENDTALHIACRRNFIRVAETFLTTQPRSWRWLDDDLIAIIYKKVPSSMIVWMDKAFSYVTMDFKERKLSLEADFLCITGYTDPLSIPQQETKYLHKVLSTKKSVRNKVLLHPLVQIFLNMKWEKFRWLSWASLSLHVSWLVAYTLFILEVYTEDCPVPVLTVPLNLTGQQQDPQSNCPYNYNLALSMAIILIPLSFVIALKELFRILHYKIYRRKLKGWVQWLVLFLFVFNLYPMFDGVDHKISSTQFAMAAIGVFLAWTLSLKEMAKIPRFGKYSEVLEKVSLNSILMLLFYLPILVAFSVTFRILIPGKGQYSNMPLAIVKILIMMTGEYDYDATFYGGATPRVPVPAQLMFVVFVFMATIVLLNLLIGLAVQDPDVQNIIREAEINRTSNKLEQIFILESFIIWFRKNVIGMERFARFFSSLNVTSQKIGASSFYSTQLIIHKKYFPADSKDEIHCLALGTRPEHN